MSDIKLVKQSINDTVFKRNDEAKHKMQEFINAKMQELLLKASQKQ